MDNLSMEDPTQVTIDAKHTHNTMESTAPPTKGTTHTKNITDTYTKIFMRRKIVDREKMTTEMIILLHPRIYVWVM